MNNHHLRMRGGNWVLVKEGSEPAIKSFWTKREGVTYSLSYIERHGGTLAIHRLDGSLQEEFTYPVGGEPIHIAA